jgi:hypothetical protein
MKLHHVTLFLGSLNKNGGSDCYEITGKEERKDTALPHFSYTAVEM